MHVWCVYWAKPHDINFTIRCRIMYCCSTLWASWHHYYENKIFSSISYTKMIQDAIRRKTFPLGHSAVILHKHLHDASRIYKRPSMKQSNFKWKAFTSRGISASISAFMVVSMVVSWSFLYLSTVDVLASHAKRRGLTCDGPTSGVGTTGTSPAGKLDMLPSPLWLVSSPLP